MCGLDVPNLVTVVAQGIGPLSTRRIYALSVHLEAAIEWLLSARHVGGDDWKREGSAPAPIVFDTGQVIFGWLAACREVGRGVHFRAAMDAADWLISVQDQAGAWMRGQHRNTVKVIDTRVAWALLDLTGATSHAVSRSALAFATFCSSRPSACSDTLCTRSVLVRLGRPHCP
jgi:hypothetical protein